MTFKIGFHVSISGGIQNSVLRAQELGCAAFQIFTRNPRGWTERQLTESEIESFKSNLKKSKIQSSCVAANMPFIVNLSGPDGELHEKSINAFTNELIRTSQLGIGYLVADIGSDMGHGKENGIKQLVKSCEKGIDNYRQAYKKKIGVTILLQNGWGSVNSLGSRLEDLREILDRLPNKGFGICLDTCHAFIAGYDLRTRDSCTKFMEEFKKIVGLNAIKLVHLNDSKTDLGSHTDHHEHIGLGKIGLEGLATIINHSTLRDLPMIMQVPIDSEEDYSKNLKTVLKLRT